MNEGVSYSLDATDRHGVAIPINKQIATRHKAMGERTGLGIGANGDPAFTLQARHEHGVAVLNDQGGSMMSVTHEATGTLRSQEHGHQPIIVEPRSQDGVPRIYEGVTPTLNTAQGGQRQPCVCIGNGQMCNITMRDLANTLDTMHDKQAVMVYGIDSNKNGYREQTGAIQAHENGGATEFCCDRHAIVRRLTPLECERLQGFPDGWTDIGEWADSKGKKRQTTDTARYKALGNSIALPFWFWLLRRISAQYERPATLGSLFDGLGGFPLCWEWCNGKGTAIWASEIEEFPIAVTKRRFGDD